MTIDVYICTKYKLLKMYIYVFGKKNVFQINVVSVHQKKKKKVIFC